MKNKIIITGGLGFIFSHVAEYFLNKEDWDVYVLDNLSIGSHAELIPEFTRKGMHFYEKNVSLQSIIELIKTIDPDYIIHAAAISDVDYSIKEPFYTIHANNDATLNVFEAARNCKNLKKLLYVSTDEVYGECDHPKTEDEIIFPRNPYSLSKAFGSILRLSFDNTYPELKNKTCETRFCNVFGPRQDARKILPAIKRALNGGDPVKIHNDGEGYRQFIHVEEIPPILEILLEKGNRTYNITSGEGFTVKELVSLAEEISGRQIPTIIGSRSGMDMRYEMSSARLEEEFGWKMKKFFRERFKEYLKS